jgi:hypothetical protein
MVDGRFRPVLSLRPPEQLGALLKGGLTPAGLARALTLGMLLGCMPLVWGTTLLCLGAALLLRLNPLAVQVGNLAVWPLQLLLAYPYLRLGTTWFGPASLPATGAPSSWLAALVAANGIALGAWVLTAPLLLPACYLASRLLAAAVGRVSSVARPVVQGGSPGIPPC